MSLNDLLKQLSNLIVIDITLLRVIIAVIFILIGLFFRHIFVKGVMKFLLDLAKKTKSNLDEMLVYAIEKPAKVLILGFSFWLALSILGLPSTFQHFLNLSLRTVFILALFWFFYRTTESLVLVFERYLNKTEKKMNPVLVGILGKIIKTIIVILEIFIIIKEWGYDVSGLIAGLGIGGLAFSLAAKDAASNFLGSITIMLDKTYRIGDWIETEKAEGIVEEIGFRSTKLRTFEDALISVPNSIMSNEPVTNWSKMGKRKIKYILQIPLDTPSEKIEALLNSIREMLKCHADINQDTIVVNLKGFGEATLEVLFHFFTKTTSWITYMAVSEDIALKVLHIFNEIGIPITVPANRMLVESKQPLGS